MTETEKKLKKNRSAYILYCIDHRELVKTENKGIVNKNILVKLGEKWSFERDNKTDIHAQYLKKAEDEKEKFLQDKSQPGYVEEVKKVKKPRAKKVSKSAVADTEVAAVVAAPSADVESEAAADPAVVVAPKKTRKTKEKVVSPVLVEDVVSAAPVVDTSKKASKSKAKKQV